MEKTSVIKRENRAMSLKFAQRVSKSEEDKSSEERKWKIEDKRDQLKANIKATKRGVKRVTREIDGMKDNIDVDWMALVGMIGEQKALKEGLKIIKKLYKELF